MYIRVSINDIWGVVDQVTGKRTILCAATNPLQGGEHKLLSINETGTVDTISWPPQKELWSVWFENSQRVFTAGEGLFQRQANGVWREFLQTPRIGTSKIRGNATNDLFAVGGFGLVLHFSGVNRHEYPEANAAFAYTSAACNGSLLVAVGGTSTRAVVVQMRR
jgi:hypothetical protein